MPGLPDGKLAGERCLHLTADYRCALFGTPERPDVCNRLQANAEMCGQSARHAYRYLARLERQTRPGGIALP